MGTVAECVDVSCGMFASQTNLGNVGALHSGLRRHISSWLRSPKPAKVTGLPRASGSRPPVCRRGQCAPFALVPPPWIGRAHGNPAASRTITLTYLRHDEAPSCASFAPVQHPAGRMVPSAIWKEARERKRILSAVPHLLLAAAGNLTQQSWRGCLCYLTSNFST